MEKQILKTTFIVFFFAAFCLSASFAQEKKGMMDQSNWSEDSKKAIEETRGQYGEPDEVSENMMIWRNKGPWKEIHVYSEAVPHDWPAPHMDVLKGIVDYKVPASKYDDLGMFDGSVTVDRTKGTIAAKCDKEANNFLALNLAHDIIQNARTYPEARAFFEKTAKAVMEGDKSSPYLQKIGFKKMSNTMDKDMAALKGKKMEKMMKTRENKMKMNMEDDKMKMKEDNKE